MFKKIKNNCRKTGKYLGHKGMCEFSNTQIQDAENAIDSTMDRLGHLNWSAGLYSAAREATSKMKDMTFEQMKEEA